MDLKKAFATNKETWNKKVPIHAKSDFYNVAGFKEGDSSLNTIELEGLGDVAGKSLLHLQCHFGQDTISFSRLGARCTGVDISDTAIKLATELAADLNENAQFVCCNVLDTSKRLKSQFDIVFTSYGAIGWLPDLKPWARMIAERLKPGGQFYIVEFHPIPWMFDYLKTPPELKYGYQQSQVIYEEYKGTYADVDAEIVSREYCWNHGLGEVISSLTAAGLHIEFLNEHQESPYEVFPDMVKNSKGNFELPAQLYPLLFEIKATKPLE